MTDLKKVRSSLRQLETSLTQLRRSSNSSRTTLQQKRSSTRPKNFSDACSLRPQSVGRTRCPPAQRSVRSTAPCAHPLNLSYTVQIREQLSHGTAPLDKDYAGPMLSEDGLPTVEFVDSLLAWFKDGKVLPRRIAWQIVLGAQEQLVAEPTLVECEVPEGETINV